jgi:hypothetical protein
VSKLAAELRGVLRGESATPSSPRPGGALAHLSFAIIACGAVYGAVMGSYGGLTGGRLWQVAFSATKVPLLLAITFALSLPSFFVLNTLFGVRDDFGRVLRALVAGQAALALVLVTLAPYTVIWYISFGDYRAAILFNGAMFAAASLAAQWQMRRSYRPLIARNPRHRLLRRVWLLIYVFVGIQMGWVLRPFVGDPSIPPQFLRAEAWGNAYVTVVRIIWNAITR